MAREAVQDRLPAFALHLGGVHRFGIGHGAQTQETHRQAGCMCGAEAIPEEALSTGR